MIKIRGVVRGLALLAPTIVLLTAVQPAHSSAPADFTQGVQKAVSKSLSGYKLREKAGGDARATLDSKQRVRADSATFAAPGRVLIVVRGVGADPEVSPKRVLNGQLVNTLSLPRPGAGARQAVVSTTADQWGPGLTILAWSERRGVNYQIVVRGGVAQQDLVKLAKALPKDASKATAKARATIAKVKPPAPSGIDEVVKQPQAPNKGGIVAQSPGRGVVDGAGTTHDDLGNESTLCNGCSYWNSNYAGMWQHILYDDGNLAFSGIDCQFGSTTASATRAWQRREGLSSDGIVGANTRGRADNFLIDSAGDEVIYIGNNRSGFYERSSSSGLYYFSSGPRVNYNRSGGAPPGC